jgi:oligopeptide transport system substrate-binding protein
MDWTEAGKIVSNAAYQLDAWEPGRIMRFSRNPFYPDYFHGNVDQVEIFFYPDYASINPAFISGQLDAMEITSPIIQEIGLDHYRETGQLSMFAPSTVDLIYFPRDRPPFDDLRLRKAFVLATDKEELANEVLKGLAIPATGGVVPPALPGHSPGIGLPYDLEKARRLLAEAGYPNGQGFPPLILGVWEGMKTTYPLFLQESWKRNLGITVQMEWWNQKTSIGENWHFLLGAWGADFPDPESFLGGDYFLGGAVHLQHAGVETLIESGRRILNQEHRLELYRQADRILIEEAIVAPILYFAPHALLQPWVHYPGGSTIMRSYWKDIILNPH